MMIFKNLISKKKMIIKIKNLLKKNKKIYYRLDLKIRKLVCPLNNTLQVVFYILYFT